MARHFRDTAHSAHHFRASLVNTQRYVTRVLSIVTYINTPVIFSILNTLLYSTQLNHKYLSSNGVTNDNRIHLNTKVLARVSSKEKT